MRSSISAAIVFVMSCIGPAVCSISAQHLPSIAELEKLSFTAASKTDFEQTSLSDISDARALFLAFEANIRAVSKYQDPLLTRGGPGQAIFRSASPSVVAVVVGSFDKDNNFNPNGLGTGAIVDPRGYIITNWHVINGYRGAIVFLKPAGGGGDDLGAAFGAKLIYEDPKTDLALLKMLNPPSNLHALSVGDISHVEVAEDIHIIGHPHGNFWSYSTGVVSQIRDRYSWSYQDGSKHEAKVLQLQSAINPGNSGGPVLDDAGNILGLVAMSEEGQNLDYAIAADVIKQFLLTGMQMTTRGSTAHATSTPPQQVASAKLSDGSGVSKATYPNAVLYVIVRKDGSQVGVVAKFNDGSVVYGTEPDENGDIRSWSAELSGGAHLVARASGGFVTQVSRAQLPVTPPLG